MYRLSIGMPVPVLNASRRFGALFPSPETRSEARNRYFDRRTLFCLRFIHNMMTYPYTQEPIEDEPHSAFFYVPRTQAATGCTTQDECALLVRLH
jgi:hypothetical protein